MTTWSILSRGMRRKWLSTQVWRTTPREEVEEERGMLAAPGLLLETRQNPSQELPRPFLGDTTFGHEKGWVLLARSTVGQTDPQL